MDKEEMKVHPTDEEMVENTFSEIFEGVELPEDFRNKAKTLIEATINERVLEKSESLRQEITESAETQIEEFTEEKSKRISSFMNYVAENWADENRLAVESRIRVQLAESFMDGLRDLFEAHDMSLNPTELTALAEAEARIEELEEKNNKAIHSAISIREERDNLRYTITFMEQTRDMTENDTVKMKGLLEGMTFADEEDYINKLELVKENFINKKNGKNNKEELETIVEENDKEADTSGDSIVLSIASMMRS